MISRPRVVLVLDKMIAAGTQRHIVHLVKGLSDKIEFHVVSLEGLGEWENELKKYPIVSHHYPLHRLYDMSGFQVYQNLIYLLKKIEPVGVETFMFTAHILGSFAAKKVGNIPVISSRREKVLWRKKTHLYLRRQANRHCTLHLANSLAVARDVQDMEKVPAQRIKHLANGLDLPENPCNTLSFSPHKTHAVVLAALKPVKQHALLIEIYAEFRHIFKELELHFLGDGPLKKELETLSLEKGVKECIFFHGKVDNVLEELGAFDFSILPSKSEGFSNSLLECLGSGLPSIAFDVDGNREAIVNNRTGMLIKEGNRQEMADAMATLTNNAVLRKKMGEAARKNIKENYSLKKMCELKYKCYKEVFKC